MYGTPVSRHVDLCLRLFRDARSLSAHRGAGNCYLVTARSFGSRSVFGRQIKWFYIDTAEGGGIVARGPTAGNDASWWFSPVQVHRRTGASGRGYKTDKAKKLLSTITELSMVIMIAIVEVETNRDVLRARYVRRILIVHALCGMAMDQLVSVVSGTAALSWSFKWSQMWTHLFLGVLSRP